MCHYLNMDSATQINNDRKDCAAIEFFILDAWRNGEIDKLSALVPQGIPAVEENKFLKKTVA